MKTEREAAGESNKMVERSGQEPCSGFQKVF